MQKFTIKNRKGQNVVIVVERPDQARGLAFIMHGLGGLKEQPHIATSAKCFFDNGITAVRFDATNSFGESDGRYEDATVTNYFEDLQDVIRWSESQAWYQEPFWLEGHSLGGICSALYAEQNPEKVKGLAPISTVVSGKLSLESHDRNEVDEWERTGWKISESKTSPGGVKKLKWSHMVDRLKYDLLPEASRLAMPVLLIVGDKDISTPAYQQQILFDRLPGKKELHLINGAEHTFREPQHLDEIYGIIDRWIKNNE